MSNEIRFVFGLFIVLAHRSIDFMTLCDEKSFDKNWNIEFSIHKQYNLVQRHQNCIKAAQDVRKLAKVN